MTNQTQHQGQSHQGQSQQARAFNAPLAYADYKAKYAAFLVAAVTAFLASAYFTIGYFAGHLRVYEYGYTEWLNFLVGFGITLALTLFQYFLYSRDKGKHGGKAAIAATVVAVCFGLLSEIGQGMERDEARMLAKSANSGTYKALLGALVNAPAAKINPYAGQLAEAERKLTQCRELLAKGKTPHCNGDAQRVESLKASSASAESTAASTSLALVDKSRELERDEKNYHPLVNLARTTLGFSAIVASFLVSLTIVGFFEYAFHHLGHNFSEAKELLLSNGYDVSRKVRTPPRKIDSTDNTPYSAPISAFVDSSKLNVKDYAEKVEEALKRAPENIAMSLAKTQHQSEQFYKGVADKLSKDDFKRNLLKTAKQLILTGDMTPTLPAVKKWVESSMIIHGIRAADHKLEPIAKSVLEYLVKDGTLIKTESGYELKNPNQTYREAINNGLDVYPIGPLDAPIQMVKPNLVDKVKHPPVDRVQPDHLDPVQPSTVNCNTGNCIQEPESPSVSSVNSEKTTAYAIAEQTKVGQVAQCPQCGQSFTKANKWHLFCSNNRKPRADGGNCSDDWHNTQNPERAKVLKAKFKQA